jgi:CBS domain-containing protein
MLTARDLMTKNPVTIAPTAKLYQAAQALQALDIRHLPVVEEGELIGMLSDRDLRALSIPYIVGGDYASDIAAARNASVATIMSGNVYAVEPEAGADEIVELMLEQKIGAVPVTDPDGKLVGIVSYMDVLREIPLEAD